MSVIASMEGTEKLFSKLRDLGDDEAYRKALEKSCRAVEREAKKKAPRDDGILEASITHEIRKEGSGMAGYVGTNVEYGPYQEFGTGKYAENGNGRKTPWAYEDPKTGEVIWTAGNKPHPFLRPALNESRDKVKQILKDAIVSAKGKK